MTGRTLRLGGAAVALAVLLPLGSAPAFGSPGTVHVIGKAAAIHSTPDVTTLRARAEALHQQLGALRGQQEWTREHLADARTRLDAVTSQSITADEELATLQGASNDAEIDIAHRVRAIEQSGGAAALFTQALDANAITDVASNVAALNGVLTTDVVRA